MDEREIFVRFFTGAPIALAGWLLLAFLAAAKVHLPATLLHRKAPWLPYVLPLGLLGLNRVGVWIWADAVEAVLLATLALLGWLYVRCAQAYATRE
jgi:hypothetical protein